MAKENRPRELYDMENDRTDPNDVTGEQTRLAQQLADKWNAWAEQANVLPLGTCRGKK